MPQIAITVLNKSFLSTFVPIFAINGTVATPAAVIRSSTAEICDSLIPMLKVIKNTRSDENVMFAIRYARLEPMIICTGFIFKSCRYSRNIVP